MANYVIFTLALLTAPLFSPAAAVLDKRQAFALAGIGLNGSTSELGNAYNYWSKLPNGTFDLTRSNVMPVTEPKLVSFSGTRHSAIIEPSRSVLAIVDMRWCPTLLLADPHLALCRSLQGKALQTPC